MANKIVKLTERKRIVSGIQIEDFLKSYGFYNVVIGYEEHDDFTIVGYVYAITPFLKPSTPRVEFEVDEDDNGFISGYIYLNGDKGDKIDLKFMEDLEYFVKNAKQTESKKSTRKSIKEETYNVGNYTYPKVVTVDNVDKILKSVRDNFLDGYRFNCENIDISDLIYSNSFQKYFLNGGKIEWSKIKKSPFNNELVVLGKLIGNNYYDINIALESKENPFGYSKISHFNFFKKFDWTESKKSVKKSLKESVDGYIATDEDCNMSGKCWVLGGSYNFIMDFLQEWGIAPKDVKVKNGMTTLFNADGNPFGYVYQDEEVDIFVADKTTNWTWKNHNPSTKRVKVTALDEIF